MLRTTKKEMAFYTAFIEVSTLIHATSLLLEDLINHYTDVEAKVKELERSEHDCDMLVHVIFEKVNAAFVTPIDREDICAIAAQLDNIMDAIEDAGKLFHVYNVQEIKEPAQEFAKMIVEAAYHLNELIKLLPDMKSLSKMKQHIIEVNRVENLGDDLYRQEVSKLFREEQDAIQLIRWNGIYDTLENTMDAFEDAANMIEGVVMKHV